MKNYFLQDFAAAAVGFAVALVVVVDDGVVVFDEAFGLFAGVVVVEVVFAFVEAN